MGTVSSMDVKALMHVTLVSDPSDGLLLASLEFELLEIQQMSSISLIVLFVDAPKY